MSPIDVQTQRMTFKGTSALTTVSLLFSPACIGNEAQSLEDPIPAYVSSSHHGTNQATSFSLAPPSDELYTELNNIFDMLTASQKDLAVEDRDLLYDNLWDLYE